MNLARMLTVAVVLTVAPVVSSAALPRLFAGDEPDFRALTARRDTLIQQISDQKAAIAELDRDAPVEDVRAIQAKILAADSDQKANPGDKAKATVLDDLRKDLDKATQAKTQRRSMIQDLHRREDSLQRVEVDIQVQIDGATAVNKNSLLICVLFTILVLVVICGFFYIVKWTPNVAYAIFSGSEGMQFLTLFLVVIAIILFGMMGTLEGKELAALLGGLSGYILGRTSSGQQTQDKPPPGRRWSGQGSGG